MGCWEYAPLQKVNKVSLYEYSQALQGMRMCSCCAVLMLPAIVEMPYMDSVW